MKTVFLKFLDWTNEPGKDNLGDLQAGFGFLYMPLIWCGYFKTVMFIVVLTVLITICSSWRFDYLSRQRFFEKLKTK